MAQLYFHCTSRDGVLVDTDGSYVEDLADAHLQAARIVRTLIAAPNLEDWRDWTLQVTAEDQSEVVLTLPFASLLGRSH